jgi:hypothetical protein
LVVHRGAGQPGRYQSPWLTRDELVDFGAKFGSYFDRDGRHHVWLLSPSEQATLVYDRHNVIFAYGPQDKYVKTLRDMGYAEADSLDLPFPHQHRFHAELDSFERELTALPGWHYTPLRKGDEV